MRDLDEIVARSEQRVEEIKENICNLRMREEGMKKQLHHVQSKTVVLMATIVKPDAYAAMQ